MLSLTFSIFLKVLEWAFVCAAVLTYIELGPGGDSIAAVVQSFKEILLDVDWSALSSKIGGHLQNFAGNLWDSFFNETFGNRNAEVSECLQTASDCNQNTKGAK